MRAAPGVQGPDQALALLNRTEAPLKKAPLFSLLTDSAVLTEMRNNASLESAIPSSQRESLDLLISGSESAVTPGFLTQTEAIILTTGRPALLVMDGSWEPIKSPELRSRVDAAAPALKKAIPRVGRVEIIDYQLDYIGTGWMIDEDVMVTNRHVAMAFAARRGASFAFLSNALGRAYQTRVDFLREHERQAQQQARVAEVLYIEEEGGTRPDMALLRLDRSTGNLPEPIELDDTSLKFHDDVAVIGYPAEDPRNDAFVMREIFRNIYGVKRLSPGWLSGVRPDGQLIEHDCTTLGGNSGSVIVKLATGKACGLHFAGSYLDANYAVTSAALKQRMAAIGRSVVSVPAPMEVGAETEEKRKKPSGPSAAQLENRKGYDPEFLGAGELAVPLPVISNELRAKIAPVNGSPDGELKYQHFSLKMRADRRVAFFTAVNIDGNLLYNFPRSRDVWFPDPRLARADHQTSNQLYDHNTLDRGHLVRRLDPTWGQTRAEAMQAMEDTFFFTNCSPQHSLLNQKTWLSLEDYVLKNTATHALKTSVFTGAHFQDTDRVYRGVRIPEEFWKVVVIVNEFTGRRSATGYVVSQADYLGDLEFAFGEFRTYQVPVAEIEQKTGLSFGDLSSYDPLGQIEANPHRLLRGPEDLML